MFSTHLITTIWFKLASNKPKHQQPLTSLPIPTSLLFTLYPDLCYTFLVCLLMFSFFLKHIALSFLARCCNSFSQVRQLTDKTELQGINKIGEFKQVSIINSMVTYCATIYECF